MTSARSWLAGLTLAAFVVPAAASGQDASDRDAANLAADHEQDGKWLTAEEIPTFKVAEDGTVDWYTFSGYRRYHAECHVCHGPDGQGSSYAPAIANSAVRMDYYDFIDHGGGRIGIAVADVSGKGIAAALLMSVVQASLRVIAAEGELPLAQLAAKMNGFLHQSTGANKYATFFYAELDDCGRRLRYVNAGHNPPYLVRGVEGGTEIVELDVGGTVLGLFPEVDYQEAELGLRRGDLIVAFTDGVTEAHNAEGDEFGEARLQALLREHADAAAEQVASKLAETMRLWIGGAEQHDDLTFVVLKVN